MYLKFIGEDKSMGLRHGSIYKVKVTSDNNHIMVWWDFGWFKSGKCCPYASLQSLAANWAKP